MHKKILGLFIVLGSILGITNATFNNVLEYNLPGYAGYRGDSYILNEIDKQINIENNQIVFYTPANNNRYLTFGRVNSKPYIIETYSNSTIYGQGEPYVCISDIDNYKTYCDPYNYNSQGKEAGRNAMKQQGILTGFENVNLSVDFDKFIYPLCSESYNCDTSSVFGFEGMIGFASTNNNYVILFPYTITYSANNYFIHTGNLVSNLTNATSNSVRFDIFDTTSPFITPGPGTEGGPISCINIQTQIMLYGSKYNTGMCYTNGKTFSGMQIIQTGKQSIFELYPSYNNFREALTIYSTYCNPNSPTTPEYCQQQMSQYSEYTYQFYNYLQQANNENTVFSVESEKLYQYCHLQLEYTEEEKQNNCKETVDNYYATGVNEETSNGNPFEGVTERVENNIKIAVPQTGTVFDEFLEGDIWNISITDRYDNFLEIFHKITGLFKYRATQQGIIPGYITGLIMLILLLALFKK